MTKIILITLTALTGAALVALLFWRRAGKKADPENNWQQDNHRRTPSLEKGPGAAQSVSEGVVVMELGQH